MLMTKYGTQFGLLPNKMGRFHFVAPADSYAINGQTYAASDSANQGLRPERALRSVAQAITNARASEHEVIVLLPGTHTVTATVAVSKAGLTFWGMCSSPRHFNVYKPDTILTSTGTDDELLNITAGDTEIGYLGLRGSTARSAVSFQTTSAISGLYLHNTYFDLNTPAVSVETRGLDFSNRAGGSGIGRIAFTTNVISGVLVEDCVFESDGAQGSAIHCATVYATFRRCHLFNTAGTWASPFSVATGSDNILVDSCIWSTSGTMTVGIEGYTADAADGVTVINSRFARTTQTNDNFDANEVQFITNYNPTSGGTLVTIL